MADLRTFIAVSEALGRLSLRHGTEQVLEVVEAWVAYIHRVEEILAQYEAPDTPQALFEEESRGT